MKKALLLLSSSSLFAAAPVVAPPTHEEVPVKEVGSLSIDAKSRALDYQQAYQQLSREKTAANLFFQLTDGSTVSNIVDMSLMSNSTLIVFRLNTPDGVRLRTVRVEEIADLTAK